MNTSALLRLGAPVLAAAFALTGCAGGPSAGAPAQAASGQAAPAGTPSGPASSAVTVSDAWVKAAPTGMTGAFGTIANTAPRDVTLVAASTDAAHRAELHETVAGSSGQPAMRAKDGGFTIPAGGSLTLRPGADHIMLMDLAAPLRAGDDVTVTLTFSDHSTLDVTARVKDFSGANESYVGTPSAAAGAGH